MFKWERLGKLFDPADLSGGSWMRSFAQSPSAIVLADRIRVFLCTRPPADESGLTRSRLSFIDLDRTLPTRVLGICEKSPLPLGEPGTFDEFGTNPISVLRDKSRLLVYYAGWTRCESVPFNACIGVAQSDDDGLTFKKLGPGPVLSYTPDEPFLIGSPRVRKFGDRFYLWYVAGKRWIPTSAAPEPLYKLRMAESEDGLTWTKHGSDLLADQLGEEECQACGDVTFRDGAYHMFFCYRESRNYKTAAGGYRIGYAVSSDLYKWSRHDELAGFTASGHGFDSEMVSYPHLFEVDGKFYLIYQGNGMGQAGIGIAQLTSWGRA